MEQKPESEILEDAESATTRELGESSPTIEEPETGPNLMGSGVLKTERLSRDSNRPNAEGLGMGAKVVPETECVQRVKFPEMRETPVSSHLEKIDYLRDVNLEVSVELGNTVLSINHILGLDAGSVVELNQTVGEEVKILINGNAYAFGEVVVIGEKFGVRIIRIIHDGESS